MKTHKSISHLTGREQNSLHCIKNKLAEHLHPLIIYCFSSSISNSIQRNCFTLKKKVEDWNFSCDLLVVLPNDTAAGDNAKKEIEELTEAFGKVRIIIHPLDFVVQHLNEGNLFFSWVHRSGVILYEKSNATQLLPPPINGRQEYRGQAERFYLENPTMINYMEEKLVPVNPVATESKERKQSQNIEIRLIFEVKDGNVNIKPLL